MGTQGLSANSVIGLKNDYERACATHEYLDVLSCGQGKVLILGDEPLQSALVWTDNGNLVIVRWVYAQSGQEEKLVLPTSLNDASEVSERVSFQIEDGILVLFDSALHGGNVAVGPNGNHIKPGQYEITTEKLEQKGMFSFLLHKFELRC
jgi:hypothetical protein